MSDSLHGGSRRQMAAASLGALAAGIVLLGAVVPDPSAEGRTHYVLLSMLGAALATGPLIDRLGARRVLMVAPAPAAAALAMVAARGFSPLAMALLGVGVAALLLSALTFAGDAHPEEPRGKNAALSLAGAGFGVGIGLPLLVGPTLSHQPTAAGWLYAAAAFALIPAVCAALAPPPPAPDRPRIREASRQLQVPLVHAFGVLLFLQTGGEFILLTALIPFLTADLGISEREARFLLAVFWGGIVAGRLLLNRILRRVRGGAVVRFGALCAVFGIGLLVMGQSDISAIPTLLLAGLGVAGIAPTSLALAGSRIRPRSGAVSGVLFAAALSGGMALPWFFGLIVNAYGFREAWMLPVLGFVMIFFLQTFIDRALRAPRIAGVLALVALAAVSANAQTRPADYFPMAVWYGGGKARAPMLEPDPAARKEAWRADLKQIKRLGFNSIRCWIDWASGEPREGRHQFDTVETLLALAEQEGLRVVIQVYMDAAPDWVGRKFPDSLYEAAGGQKMQSESSPGFCFDHPGVREAELAFFTALARRAARSPAFLGWDLWSEPHVINWATANYLYRPEFCFCPSSVARFREWLKKKYGSLDALNRAWYRRFESWSEVSPGRLSTILSYSDYIDWRTFLQEKLGEDLGMRYAAVKRGAPDRIATSHAAIPSLFTSPHAGDGSPDDWLMVKQVDYYGTSFYPKHSMPVGRDPAWRGALLDFERSSGYGPTGRGGFWIGELQGGFGTVALNVSATVTAADLRMWTWSAIARGAKGINFYAWYPMSTGYESGGYGLIQLDGSLTERSRAAGEIARAVDRNQALLLAARPPKAQVAILFNPLSYMVGGRQRAATFAGPQSEVGSIERDSWLGAYRALFPTNTPVDFVHINEITAPNLSGYKLVIFPYPLMMPEKAAAVLREYVETGGALVSEARLAWNNERGHAAETIPGLGLSALTGCRETAVQSVQGLRTELTWSVDEILKPGVKLPARLYEETLEPTRAGARVAARFAGGAPAAVLARAGKGRTLTLGSYLAVAYEQQRDTVLQQFFAGLLDWAGVERPVEAPVEVRWLESGGEKIVFLFNHVSSQVDAEVRWRWKAASASDFATGAPVALPLRKRMAPEEAWVVRVKER
jgi:beta-galactosidase